MVKLFNGFKYVVGGGGGGQLSYLALDFATIDPSVIT